MVMLFMDLVSWWYSQGWQQVAKNNWNRIIRVSNLFSVPILLRTLLAPWRRIITYPGASLDAKLRAFADNLVSRCIGFTVRLLVLITATVMMVLAAIAGLATILLWPLVPLLIIFCVVRGVGLV